jgi:nucleoside-diphosphate-sugar epimerase
MKAVGYQPKINIEEGLRRFVEWYQEYHGGSVKS